MNILKKKSMYFAWSQMEKKNYFTSLLRIKFVRENGRIYT